LSGAPALAAFRAPRRLPSLRRRARCLGSSARRAGLALLVLAWASAASSADPLATVPALTGPGPYPVACSDVTQDFLRLRPGETAEVYWEGQPRDDGTPRYLTDLLATSGGAYTQPVAVPDDRELYGPYRGGSYALSQLVCYPTRADNPRPDYVLPDGRRVPRMQRAGEAPVFADGVERWPVIAFSHGLGGSPLGSGYLDFIVQFASYGYVVVAPFHGDPRFAKVKLEGLVDVILSLVEFPKFIAMQAVRPLGLVATLDLAVAHPHWRDRVDAGRIGGFGASLGGEAMMLAGGAALTTTVGQSSKRVLIEPRIRAAVGYVPYFGQPILPAFGRDQRGVDGVVLPFLAIGGGADLVAPLSEIEDAMVRLGSTRQLVVLDGTEHGLDPKDAPDIFTWSLVFLDGQVKGDPVARAAYARMATVAGGNDDRSVYDYSAPSAPAGSERTVIEYRNASLDHYFLTAEPDEAAMLDAGVVVPGWTRTGMAFKASLRGTGQGLPACRFFGTPGIGPSSHFYTVDVAECAKVRADPFWTFEEFAFAVEPAGVGVCAEGRVPVTRLYNNGKNNQANHRYLTSRSETAKMTDEGWMVEGPVFCALP
jgi:predicted dienelactone hydrolase